ARPRPSPYTTLFRSVLAHLTHRPYRLQRGAVVRNVDHHVLLGMPVEPFPQYMAEPVDAGPLHPGVYVVIRDLLRTHVAVVGTVRSEEHTSELQSREN